MLDGALDGLDDRGPGGARTARFAPDITVLTTAPTYLFWRCAQPELDHPRGAGERRSGRSVACLVAIGPHGSATPRAVLDKLPVDLVVMGEAEEVVQALAGGADPAATPGVVLRHRPPDAPRRRAPGRPLRRSPGARLARRLDRAPTTTITTVSSAPRRARRRGRGLARLPLQLQLLRQAPLPRPLPPAPARARARGDRPADRPGRDLPLLRRRDLPAAARSARGARPAPGAVRRADPDRPLEAGAARAARRRRAASRSRRASRASPSRAARRSTRGAA